MDKDVRIDKWLWAARFFKTRSLAAKAVAGGHIHLNGARVKASRLLRIDDRLTIRRGDDCAEIIVQAIDDRRGPATQAALLYEETVASKEKREETREAARLRRQSNTAPTRRPDKKSRRLIRKFQGRD